MRRHFLGPLVVILGCANPSLQNPPPEPWQSFDVLPYGAQHGVFGVFELLSTSDWSFVSEVGHRVVGTQYQVREIALGPGGHRRSNPPWRPITITSSTHISSTPSGPFDDRPHFARLDVGRRLLLASSYWRDDYHEIVRACRVETPSNALAEECFGFPVGTPIDTVFAATVVAQGDGGSSDGGPADAGSLP